ncbi:hypothetical protein BK004_01590 [bacterium CG10_46_32]|nr:MAG: hypothetical protein BK004_01590 [bacterium CG10_46_32]PIR56276.1 MAG: hypothetical protein COU73_01610 [Parcubacteria group bacterium CG10_big_fil_rev_8_21_14_0_10_46_32]
MKKFFIVISLLLVIFCSFGFVFLGLMARGSDDNYFNTHWRQWFSRVPVWRYVLSLHYDGDGREDFIGSGYGRIVVEVYGMDGLSIDSELMQSVADRIQGITKKPTSVVFSNVAIPYVPLVRAEDVLQIARQYRRSSVDRDTAGLYVLFASAKEEEPTLLGSTYQEDGIILYVDAMKDFTRNAPETFGSYVVATILHEFGHQISLQHNDQPDCLMNEHAEANHTAKNNPSDVVVDFCEYELGGL